MIKDIVCHLALGGSRDAAPAFAVSIAEAFSAHVSGVAFAYEPVLPVTMMGGDIPVDFVEFQQNAAEQAATVGVRRFEQAARLAAIGFESRVITATLSEAADVF